MDCEGIESRAALLELVPKYRWVHSIDLGDGVRTPGAWGAPPDWILRAFDDIDFRGKTVLDIGCWDGLWSFEAERRGAAAVYATDDLRQRNIRHPTFSLARKLLGSQVHYRPDVSVYEVHRLAEKPFDIVLFLGVYYHLKHPLLALSRLRQITREGGLILVEGETISSDRNYAAFYYHEHYKDDCSNWWVPTVRCLREWVQCSFFQIRNEYTPAIGPKTRHAILAEAVRGVDPNYAYPDDELSAFCLNSFA
ncbi:MAG: DUF1698 domain-containing protein [Isosphaeraceae bacterium]|nr:DUF1698 domain-containing protein [Isosphaeraceae bacterium]